MDYKQEEAEAFFLGAESDPVGEKHKGRERKGKRMGRRHINETGVKEKYWVDVMLQMLNARGWRWACARAQKTAGAGSDGEGR